MTAEPRTVQLVHELPDGGAHVDWMLDRTGDPGDALVTFRLGRRIDEIDAGGTIDAERIGDHRRRYLDYEGPIAGGRGSVRRIRAGRILGWTVVADCTEGDAWEIRIAWDGAPAPQHLRVERAGDGGCWRILVLGAG